MKTSILPCMGGWCRSRDRCLHYVFGSADLTPSERLCGATEEPEPVKAHDSPAGGNQ